MHSLKNYIVVGVGIRKEGDQKDIYEILSKEID
jgi:hypothetical protein